MAADPSARRTLLTHPRSERLRERALAGGARLWDRLFSRRVGRLYHYDMIYRTGNFRSTKWVGTPILQNVLDLWTIQETISELRPALLIEIGTNRGGSAMFYANLMDLLGTGHILTVDIERMHELDHPRITFLHGSSTDPETVAQAQAAADAATGPVLVILDGNHERDHVAAELEFYAPMVTPGSFILSQDGVIDQFWMFRDSRPGPLGANEEFLTRHPEFEHDRERNDRFRLSHHPVGWLRRKSSSG